MVTLRDNYNRIASNEVILIYWCLVVYGIPISNEPLSDHLMIDKKEISNQSDRPKLREL